MIAKFDQKGSILIGIIVAMVLFAALGAAILSLTSTATMNQVMANSAARAYYLAESGLRYAYNLGDDAAFIESRLKDLHSKTFTLDVNDGRFEFQVFPYYLQVYVNPQGRNTLQAEFQGGFENLGVENDVTHKVQIGSEVYYYRGKIQPFLVNQLYFSDFPDPLPYIPVGTDVFFMALASGQQSVDVGGDILLKPNTGIQFPLRNGIVEIDGHICSYREHAGNMLTGIKIYDDPPNSFDISDAQEIVLQKFAKIVSTGTFGEGNLQTERKLVYYVPFPIRDRGKKVDFHEKFDDGLSRWQIALNKHQVQEIAADNALKVTGTDPVGTSDSGSLAVFKWPDTVIDLKSSYKQAGNFLSYDAQVKIGFVPTVATSYMAGISFRIAGEGSDPDSYGISFVKSEEPDGIPDDLVPPGSSTVPAIVLWQKTAAGKKWLAYKSLPELDPANATILVRIIEAASVKFINGGTIPVKAGDRVIGRTSGAKGRVVGSPILDNGGDDWAGNNAAGRILLNNIIGTFTSGEPIDVVGSTTTLEANGYRLRDNYIRAYYGEEAPRGTENEDPLDTNRGGTPRGTIHWPPDNTDDWSDEVDYFTLVSWDDNIDSSVLRLGTGKELNAIIRTNSLVTDSFSTNIPEIGLHTFGSSSTSIYFDDFAMQAVIQADPIILPPVQE